MGYPAVVTTVDLFSTGSAAFGHWPPWPGRMVAFDGRTSYVRHTPATSAAAEPAVFLHGLGGSGQNWTDLAGLLADRLDGEALDLPGFGRSEPGGDYSVRSVAGRVIRWIEFSGGHPVHLFGNSFGGTVAIWVAAHRPDLVRTLTVISPAMPFLDLRRSLHAPLVPVVLLPGAAARMARAMAGTPPQELATQVLTACFGDLSRLSPRRLAEAQEEVAARYPLPYYPTVYAHTLRGLVRAFARAYLPGAGSLWRVAERVAAPTLVVGGTADRIVDPRVAPRVARLIPGARLSMLDGVGHVAQIEAPAAVADDVRQLLGGN